MCRDETRARVVEDRDGRRLLRLFEDNSCEIGMCRGHLEREIRAQAIADHNDGRGRKVACSRQVVDGRFSIFAPTAFAGMLEVTLPVSAIVECEDSQPCVVKAGEVADGISQIAFSAVEVEYGVAASGAGGNPPAMKLRLPGSSGGEADGLKRKARICRGTDDRRGRMVEQLPTALPKEKAQSTPSAG